VNWGPFERGVNEEKFGGGFGGKLEKIKKKKNSIGGDDALELVGGT